VQVQFAHEGKGGRDVERREVRKGGSREGEGGGEGEGRETRRGEGDQEGGGRVEGWIG